MANWWQFPITQGWAPPIEYGTDYATPYGTPITALFGGVVSGLGYHPWGGEVDISTHLPGSKDAVTEYALHLDSIAGALKVGQAINPGTLLGLSGGQLSGGLHPNDPQYSTGPHLEYGFFKGSAWSGSSIDPAALIAAGPKVASTGGDPCAGLSGPEWIACRFGIGFGPVAAGAAASVPNPLEIGAGIAAAGSAFAGSISAIPTQIGHGLADFFVVGEHDIAQWLGSQAVAFFVAAVVLLVLFL